MPIDLVIDERDSSSSASAAAAGVGGGKSMSELGGLGGLGGATNGNNDGRSNADSTSHTDGASTPDVVSTCTHLRCITPVIVTHYYFKRNPSKTALRMYETLEPIGIIAIVSWGYNTDARPRVSKSVHHKVYSRSCKVQVLSRGKKTGKNSKSSS